MVPDVPALSEDEARALRRVVPPVTVPSTPVDPQDPRVPLSVRRAATLATDGGWRVALFRSCGPHVGAHDYVDDPARHCLGLRALKDPGRSVVMTWYYRGDVVKPGWRFEAAWVAPGPVHTVEGKVYRLRRELVASPVALSVLREG
jgi:hypothetical protein